MAQQHAFEGNLNWSGGSRKDEHGKLRLSRSYTLRFKDKAPIEGSSPAAFNGDDSRHNPETLMVASLPRLRSATTRPPRRHGRPAWIWRLRVDRPRSCSDGRTPPPATTGPPSRRGARRLSRMC